MKFAILFTDKADKAGIRAEWMPDHLAFLSRHAERIEAAGPLADGQSGTAEGGLWIVDVDSVADATALVEEDPFWPTGLRDTVRILEWRQVFANGKRHI